MIEDISIINHNSSIINELFHDIPCSWEGYDSFQSFISASFAHYLKQINQFKGYLGDKLKQNEAQARVICKGVEKTIIYYLKGFHSDAFLQLESLLPYIKGSLASLSDKKSPTGLAYGFRGRIIENPTRTPRREDMFHIPFQKRHLVKEHRYSVQGVPAIYLGTSIYDCYVELNSPPIKDFWVSYFCFSQDKKDNYDPSNLKLIDLTVPTADFFRVNLLIHSVLKNDIEFDKFIEDIYNRIVLWPLIKTCSIARKYPHAPFQHEYIIPTLLFQLCAKSTSISGIKYDSTQKNNCPNGIYPHALQNIAIPAHNISEKGYCSDLEARLILTEPFCATNLEDSVNATFSHGMTHNGLPILSDMHPSLKSDAILLALDKLTMHFDNLIDLMVQQKDTNLIAPLNGWD